MNDRDPFDGHDPDLTERMERAVGGLHAPDVVPRAMARGRRQRTQRRLTYAAGGVAAATALVLTVPTFAADWTGGQDPSGPPVAADPAATSSASARPTTAAPTTGGVGDDQCPPETGWWSKSPEQIKADLSALLPQGTRLRETDAEDFAGEWRGEVITGAEVDGLGLTLLPPPGVLGTWRTLEEVSRLGPCGGGANEPGLAVKPCDELSGKVVTGDREVLVRSCEEIRSEDGTLSGVVTEQVIQTVVDGQSQPTDETHVNATLAVPGGGHVELGLGDVATLTTDQVREIVTDPVWTS